MITSKNCTKSNKATKEPHNLSYNIMSLDPKILLRERTIIQGEDGNYKIEYLYDFRDLAFSKKQLISSIDNHDNNALFFQIKQLIHKPGVVWNENSLLRTLVFIDFTEIFNRFKDEGAHKKKTYSKEELKEATDDILLSQLFDPDNGFTIVFNDTQSVTFVPFDKSGSMSRTCRISFIDKSIKKALDQRLLLGMDKYFNNTEAIRHNSQIDNEANKICPIQLIPSKYYAYRGLYLFDAQRIEASENLVFNQDTVIVVKDDCHEVTQCTCSNGTKQINNIRLFGDPITRKPNTNGVLWELSEYEKERERINPFDGEGFISPKYSNLINAQLRKGGASSYQIRMPFTKGMLHCVDFNAFFNEYVSDDEQLLIDDYFGIKRDLRKAQIILTESMFKACKWIKSIWEREEKKEVRDLVLQDGRITLDPMEFFFEKVKEYKHSLYIGNTDVLLDRSNRTKINYQFINTLDMPGNEFDTIIKGHIEQINSVKTNMLASWETSNDIDMSGEEKMNSSEPWIDALRKNSGFAKNPKIRNFIEGTRESLIRDCGRGRLSVFGECRFFSCDLLALLVFLAKSVLSTNKHIKTGRLNEIQCLFSDRFYMAKPRISLYSKRRYAFFRSPHLSRNEQCALRPFIPPEDNVYSKYFSHLSGVVMVSRNSLAPMILSGADFDGDLVKVIADKNIVSSVVRGTYELKENEFVRKLPIVNIPNTKELSDSSFDTGSIPYETVKNTFSNKIGLISNLAIVAGKKEYSEKNPDYTNLCAACTIVTGLEIDAAKTGIHPTQNIKIIQDKLKEASKNKDYFLEANEIISALPRNRKITIKFSSEKPKEINVLLPSESKPRLTVNLFDLSESNVSNIDRLPGYFAIIADSVSRSSEKESTEAKNAAKHLFTFELENSQWKRDLDNSKLAETKELVQSYLAILQCAGEISRCREKYKNAKYANCAFNILKIQYDGLETPLPAIIMGGIENCSPRQALDHAYAFLDKKFFTGLDAQKALDLLIDCQWHLLSADEREEQLYKIVQMKGSETIPAEVVSILTNFSNSGYRLLYYILKDIVSDELKNLTPQKLERYKNSFTKDDEKIDDVSKSQIYKKLYAKYSEYANNNGSKKTWQKAIIKLCREQLKATFAIKGDGLMLSDSNWDEALKYIYSLRTLDKNYTFFWDILPGDVIVRNVYPVNDGGDKNAE